MASTSSIIDAMNNVTLDDEEDGVLLVNEAEEMNVNESFSGFNPNLCLVGKFISDGGCDFSAIQQTMVALWKPGKGVFIKELDANLYVFQFFHELDVRRVIDGSPWSFNRKALIVKRMEGNNPRCVQLDSLDLWMQIHELSVGCMSEKIIKEVGNFIGTHIESCSKNFSGGWKEYMRVRVRIDLEKPLKRRMKIRKSGNDWQWIIFKYENVPTFYFICGVLGHSEKFCSKLFDTPENEITKPYGAWMRAPFRRQAKLIGAKWLRTGIEDDDRREQSELRERHNGRSESSVKLGENYEDKHQEERIKGLGNNVANFQKLNGADEGILQQTHYSELESNKKGISIIENKKGELMATD